MCARYYPKGSANNIRNPDNPLTPGNNTATLEDNSFARWVYGQDHEWDAENLARFRMLYAVGPTRSYIDYLLDLRADQAYLNRYGITAGEIVDPRKLRSTVSGAQMISSGLNFVSDNIKRLYH